MSEQPPSDKQLSPQKKPLSRNIKIAGIIVVVIVIAVAAIIYFNLQQKGKLDLVNFKWTDHHPLFSSPYAHVEGTIYNYGSSTAGNVQLVVRLYASQNTLLKTETIDVGDIPSGDYRNFSTDINYSGYASECETELQWRPYGG